MIDIGVCIDKNMPQMESYPFDTLIINIEVMFGELRWFNLTEGQA